MSAKDTLLLILLLAVACTTPVPQNSETEKLTSGEAREVAREALKKKVSRDPTKFPMVLRELKFNKDGMRATYRFSNGDEIWCVYSFDESQPIAVEEGKLQGFFYVDGPQKFQSEKSQSCKPRWTDLESAQKFAGAWKVLIANSKKSQDKTGSEKELEDFKQTVAAEYLKSTIKPGLSEEARRYRVQAEGAVQKKEFERANSLYAKALEIAPSWPEGHYNRALLLGEGGDFTEAILEMKKFLSLVPEGKDARTAQDKIYLWEGELEK